MSETVVFRHVNFEETYIWVRDYINNQCIIRILSGEKRLPSSTDGKFYDWQFYLSIGMYDREFVEALAQLFWWKMKVQYEEQPFQIGAVASGGTPLALAIMNVAHSDYGIDINCFNIRKHQKTYGLCNWIEGVPNDLPVMLIDDIVSSGSSIDKAVVICKSAKLPMAGAFSVIYKKNEYKIPKGNTIHYLYCLDDFDLHFEDWDDNDYAHFMREVFVEKTKAVFDHG